MIGKTHDNREQAGCLNRGDKALRKAFARNTPEVKLPTNFTYKTMNRVQQLSQRMERRNDRRTFTVLVIVTALLLAFGGAAIVFFGGESLAKAFSSVFNGFVADAQDASSNFERFGESLNTIPAIVVMAFGVMGVLLVLDRVMRNFIARKYSHRQ